MTAASRTMRKASRLRPDAAELLRLKVWRKVTDEEAMQPIEAVLIYQARIPLRKRVEHASAAHEASENLVVEVRLPGGISGFGEGIPRPYVTGETIESAVEELLHVDLSLFQAAPLSWGDVVRRCRELTMPGTLKDPRRCFGNAARCALELALLDAYGQLFQQPMGSVLDQLPEVRPIQQRRSWVRYSHVITAGSWKRELLRAFRTRVYGFRDCKVKVGVGRDQSDAARLRRMRRVMGWGVDLRVDANEAWRADEVKERVEELLGTGVTAVEQPVRHEEVEHLAQLRGRIPVAFIHDESVCSLEDARRAVEAGSADMFNIRLSKCGGFLPSALLAAFAHRHGLGYQLGCQVGETGILSAAGRWFACGLAGLRYREGSYDRHLVAERLTKEDLTFGWGGWAKELSGSGLGVTLDRQALERVTVRRWVRNLA
jgi:L-alanine-DL-glutamate epimerase-like enolase superfamily enzyme